MGLQPSAGATPAVFDICTCGFPPYVPHYRHTARAEPMVMSGAGRALTPIRYSSIARAAPRPSLMAQTTSDWPRRQSPAANTPGTLVA